jgi:hypothetical protein
MNRASRDLADSSGYEIRIDGHLEDRWSAWFDGLALAHDGDGTTVIRTPAMDQAALHGLLRRVRDVGLPLVSVTRLAQGETPESPGQPSTDTTRRRLS